MANMGELIEQYKSQIELLEKRVNELTQELAYTRGGHQNELHNRIKFLNQEIENMWYAINMMKEYVKE